MPINFEIKVKNKKGLHINPSQQIAQLALGHPQTEIVLSKDGNSADAKSILSILSLEISFENTLQFSITGDNEKECHEAILKLNQEEVI
ncbi:MAG: HPr family phosphocarrier protein [Candidatus Margulisbacteria bacterium]|nr:HPr family phosphocarrier protein [Candidatus Margulisiibacteriota bacterium]